MFISVLQNTMKQSKLTPMVLNNSESESRTTQFSIFLDFGENVATEGPTRYWKRGDCSYSKGLTSKKSKLRNGFGHFLDWTSSVKRKCPNRTVRQ